MTQTGSPNGVASGATPDLRAETTVPQPPSPATVMEAMSTRQDLAVIQFFDRLDRLYREQIDARDREIAVKDRLIGELERRALQAEENSTLLKDYIAHLSPGSEYQTQEETIEEHENRPWWRFWR